MLCDMTTDAMDVGWTASDRDSFGARLALIRQRKGWGNVKEAALACGIPPESWRGWERDGALPRDLVAVARKISDATGCGESWLISGPPRGGGRPSPQAPTPYDPTGPSLRETEFMQYPSSTERPMQDAA